MAEINLTERDVQDDISSIVKIGSSVKFELFRACYQKRRVDPLIPQKYLGVMNGTLQKYADAIDDCVTKSKKFTMPEGDPDIYGLLYSDVKPYLYASLDYASVLKFTEGLYQGVKSGDMEINTDRNQVNEFFDHTIGLAYSNMPDSIGDIVDTINSIKDGRTLSQDEIKRFNAVRSQTIYKSSERKELFNASRKVIDFVCNDINVNKQMSLGTDDKGMESAVIASIVEYISYSVALFIMRAFIIYRYYRPFVSRTIDVPDTEVVRSVNESVDSPVDKISDKKVEYINKIDLASIREPKDVNTLYSTADEAIQMLTGIALIDKEHITRNDVLNDNMFAEQLVGNGLLEFIENRMNNWYCPDDSNKNVMKHYNDESDDLNNLLHNGSIGVPTTVSSRQEFISVLKDIGKDCKKEEISKVATDLAIFTVHVCMRMAAYYRYLIDARSGESNEPRGNLSILKNQAEIAKNVKEFYTELVEIMLSRFTDFENELNKDKDNDLANIMEIISIKVPGGEKEVLDKKELDIKSIVPDTVRFVEGVYAFPEYEALQMYSEYANYVLGEEALMEAVDFSKVVDALMATVSAWFRKIVQFFDNPRLKAASSWVIKNNNKLNTVTYNGPMNVLPYKDNISYSVLDKLTNKLNAFSDGNIKDDASLDKFINDLYDTGDANLTRIYQMDDNVYKEALINYVLFGVAPGGNVQQKTLNSDAEIKAAMKDWISTVADCEKIKASMVQSEQKSNAALRNMKAKIAGMKISTTQTDQNGQQVNNYNPEQETRLQSAITRVQGVYNKMVFPMYDIFHKSIFDQYNYIKTAYSKASQ